MGSDFCRKAAGTFKKSWDLGKLNLSTPDLFTRMAVSEGKAVPFNAVPTNVKLCQGDKLVVEKRNGCIIAVCGTSEVARTDTAPDYIVRLLDKSCGIANGTVQEVHPISGKVEISVW